jgi:hypothetical protein
MKGIELAIQDDGRLAIRCLDHNRTHIGSDNFCCADVMIRAISLAIREAPDGYKARMLGQHQRSTPLGDFLFDIATTPLLS